MRRCSSLRWARRRVPLRRGGGRRCRLRSVARVGVGEESLLEREQLGGRVAGAEVGGLHASAVRAAHRDDGGSPASCDDRQRPASVCVASCSISVMGAPAGSSVAPGLEDVAAIERRRMRGQPVRSQHRSSISASRASGIGVALDHAGQRGRASARRCRGRRRSPASRRAAHRRRGRGPSWRGCRGRRLARRGRSASRARRAGRGSRWRRCERFSISGRGIPARSAIPLRTSAHSTPRRTVSSWRSWAS